MKAFVSGDFFDDNRHLGTISVLKLGKKINLLPPAEFLEQLCADPESGTYYWLYTSPWSKVELRQPKEWGSVLDDWLMHNQRISRIAESLKSRIVFCDISHSENDIIFKIVGVEKTVDRNAVPDPEKNLIMSLIFQCAPSIFLETYRGLQKSSWDYDNLIGRVNNQRLDYASIHALFEKLTRVAVLKNQTKNSNTNTLSKEYEKLRVENEKLQRELGEAMLHLNNTQLELEKYYELYESAASSSEKIAPQLENLKLSLLQRLS